MSSDPRPVNLDNVDFHEIARRGDDEVLGTFLDAGLDPNLVDERGFPLLLIAAYNDKPGTTRLLLEHGADPNLPDARGNTPLMGMAFKGYLGTAGVLLERERLDLDARNRAGATALMMCAMFGQVELARMLLTAGADPNLVDAQGKTAAQQAEAAGHGSAFAEVFA